MVRQIQLRVSLKEESQKGILSKKVARYLGEPEKDLDIKVLRKSIDARKSTIYFNYKMEVYIREKPSEEPAYSFE